MSDQDDEEEETQAGGGGRGVARTGKRFALNSLDRAAAPPPRARGKENIPLSDAHAEKPKPSRNTRHGQALSRRLPAPVAGSSDTENIESEAALTAAPLATRSRLRSPNVVPLDRRNGPSPTERHQRPGLDAKHAGSVPTLTPAPAARSPTASRQPQITQSLQLPQRRQSLAQDSATVGHSSGIHPDRNIDKVVLGDICFRTWYPSYYGKEVLGDVTAGSAKPGSASIVNGTGVKEGTYGKAHGRRDKDGPMLDRLYVCPCCFKYSKELVAWWEHVRICEKRGFIPGTKIYTHPKGRRKVLVPSSVKTPKSGRGRRGNAASKMVERIVQDEGEWSVWEVDGEKDVVSSFDASLAANTNHSID